MTIGSTGLWRIDLDRAAPPTARLLPLLDATEQRRAAAFARDADRRRFVRSHAALRLLLGKVLARPAQEVRLSLTEDLGKPRVEPQALSGRRLDFSLAHSGGQALVGIVLDGGRIGVDLEARPAPADYRELAARHFTPDERRWLLALPAPQQAFRFLQCWTRKEAYLKAIGKGFSHRPDAMRCRLAPDGKVIGSVYDAAGRPLRQWQAVVLDKPPVAACAVIDFEPERVKIEAFDWGAYGD